MVQKLLAAATGSFEGDWSQLAKACWETSRPAGMSARVKVGFIDGDHGCWKPRKCWARYPNRPSGVDGEWGEDELSLIDGVYSIATGG